MNFVSRNDAIGLAQRSRKNLIYIKNAIDNGEDVHAVTQLVTSLLGLVVLPWERDLVKSVRKVRLEALHEKGWPDWSVTLGETETLGCLIRHLRNAAAHGRFHFSSESRKLSEVLLVVEDAKSRRCAPYWRAEIGGEDLYKFCLLFSDYIEDTIG